MGQFTVFLKLSKTKFFQSPGVKKTMKTFILVFEVIVQPHEHIFWIRYTFFNVLVPHSESRTAYYTRRTIHVSLRFILLYREMDFGWFGFYKYQCCKLPPCNICVKFEVIFGVPFLKGKKIQEVLEDFQDSMAATM